jgi:hypothetical protein
VDVKAFDTKVDCNAQTMKACLIFCSIVRCREVNSEDVAQLLIDWLYE